MRRHLLTAILAMALSLLPARAGEAPKAAKPEPGTSVEMPILVAPLVEDGKLVSYAYVSSTIVATSPAAAIEVRAHTPFIQDAYVRDVNAAQVVTADAFHGVDEGALAARLLAAARRVAGSGKVASVRLTQVQISLLHPGDGS